MINRPRTALVSVFAVTAAMVLGSSAQAQSGAYVQPQDYYKFLTGLPETRNGISLMQRYKAVDRAINYLLHIPLPGPRIVRQLASLSTQQTRVYCNINSLLARQAVLQKQYLSLQAQKESLLAAGRVFRARQVGMQQGNVFNVLNSVQRLVASERGVATPIR